MKPIIMSTEDVRALLDGRKTMARLAIKPQPVLIGMTGWPTPILHIPKKGPLFPGSSDHTSVDVRWRFAPYKPGDVLWVRETWMPETEQGIPSGAYIYKATDRPAQDGETPIRWRPSTHMPREAARLFLRVMDVRVERVQDITLKDIEQEGLYCDPEYSDPTRTSHYAYEPGMRIHFTKLWDARNAKRGYGWDTNPFCWVIEFERIEKGAEL